MGSEEIKEQNNADLEKRKENFSLSRNNFYDDLLNEDENKDNLSPVEKVKDFVSDHSDSFGCLTFFIVLGLLAWGGHSTYKHFQEKQQQEEVAKQQAIYDAEKLDSVFISALHPLVPKMTKENAPRVLNAVKHLILIDNPSANQAGLDILRKKYETEYLNHSNNSQFSDYLLMRQRELFMEKINKLPPSPFFLSILNSKQLTR